MKNFIISNSKIWKIIFVSTTDTITCPSCGESIPTDYVVCPYDGYSLIKELREKVRTKIKFREGIGRAYRLVRSPLKNTTEVMEEVATNFDRKGPLFVLIIFSFLFSFRLAAFANSYLIGSGQSAEIGFIILLGLISGFILGILLFPFTIIFWYLFTVLIHFGSRFQGAGTVSFKETASVVGYAITPFIIGLLILNFLLFVFLPLGNIIDITTEPSSLFGRNVGIGYLPGFEIVNNLHLIIYVIFAAWFVYICGTGLKVLHALPRFQAFGLPTAVMILYTWFAFFL